MTIILTATGLLIAMTLITGTAALVAAVALTDLHERVKEWVMHRIWW